MFCNDMSAVDASDSSVCPLASRTAIAIKNKNARVAVIDLCATAEGKILIQHPLNILERISLRIGDRILGMQGDAQQKQFTIYSNKCFPSGLRRPIPHGFYFFE